MDDQSLEARIRYALAPTNEEIESLELSANTKIAAKLLGDGHESVLDIGCGDGRFTRVLAGLFSKVAGIDVKEHKIKEAADTAKAEGLDIDFRTASGQEVPYDDQSFDVVAFSNSLHHMPDPAGALAEASRVLKPGGLLYIMEPVPSGTYHEATKLVNDETIVRTDAYKAMMALDGKGFTHKTEIMYRARREFDSFEAWKAAQIDMDSRRREKFDAQPDEVRRRFEANADDISGRPGFNQVFRVDLLAKD